MVLKAISSGFLIKLITGLDDTIVHVPLIASLTKTRRGRIAFSFGILLAVTLAIIISFLFASILRSFAYYNTLSALMIFILATSIYFDLFFKQSKKKVQTKIKMLKKPIPLKRILKLIGIGFLAAFVTVIDDSLAYSSLFLALDSSLFAIIGIYLAVLLELFVIISFSRKISKIPYKKEVSVFGLMIIGYLILFGVL